MQSLQVLLAVGEKGKGIAKTEKKKITLYLNKLLKKNKDNLPSTVLGTSHRLAL